LPSARHDRRDECPRIDRGVVDLKRVRAAPILWRIQRADLRHQVRAQTAGANREQQHREQERRIECHAEMTERHHQRAERDRAPAAEQAVAEHAAQQRRHVHRADVEPEDLERERLRREWPGEPFDALRGTEQTRRSARRDPAAATARPCTGQQRLHAVKRDAFPEFRAGQIEKPARVTEDVFIVHGGRGKPSRMRRQRCDDFGTRRQR
jgi:hypothetical protein